MTPETFRALKAMSKMRKQAAEEAVAPAQQMPPPEQGMEQVPPGMAEQVVPQQQAAAPAPEEAPGNPVLDMLIAAYCAEKVSEYQYEVACNAALGAARNYFLSECTEHRAEEHEHADMLAERIDTLQGVIPFTLEDVAAQNPSGSPQPVENNRDTAILTQQIIEAEQAAVELYTQIEQATRDIDPVTNDMIVGILATEQKHVVDMTKIAITIGM